GIGHRILRWALCADEEDAAAFGNGVAHCLQGAMQHRHRLGEVDDMNVVAGPEDELAHLRVPAVGLVAEMYASLQELAHREVRERHRRSPVDPPRPVELPFPLRAAGATGRPKGQGPRVKIRGLYRCPLPRASRRKSEKKLAALDNMPLVKAPGSRRLSGTGLAAPGCLCRGCRAVPHLCSETKGEEAMSER